MPKPKRPRPPVVKTDWVVEQIFDEVTTYQSVDSLQSARGWISGLKWLEENEPKKTKCAVFKRTWRKVDL